MKVRNFEYRNMTSYNEMAREFMQNVFLADTFMQHKIKAYLAGQMFFKTHHNSKWQNGRIASCSEMFWISSARMKKVINFWTGKEREIIFFSGKKEG